MAQTSLQCSTESLQTSRLVSLPAQAIGPDGRAHVDLAAILKLAFPLFLHAGLQAVLNLTDTWFIGRISVDALAGVGGVYWLILGLLLLITGMGMGVQTLAAQAYGAGRFKRAAQAVWSGLWLALFTLLPFMALSIWGQDGVALLGLPPAATLAAQDYWLPRFLGGPVAVALTVVLSFFLGIGHVAIALRINILVACLNAIFNAYFVWVLDLGVAGVSWATTASISIGLIAALFLFLGNRYRHRYWTRRVRAFDLRRIGFLVGFGFPIGLSIAFDVLGLAAFQAMLARLGSVEGAATQVVMMLTSVAYMPAVGLGKAGTTLVGQSIGAGNPDWARRVGGRVIAITTLYMLCVGLVLSLGAPLWMSLFVPSSDPMSEQVIALGIQLAFIAALYQLSDGLHIGSVFCLRGAGDTRVPALLLLTLSWGLFVPLTHFMAFESGRGWVDWMPGLNLGAAGGWWAAVIYISLLALVLGGRWFMGSWKRLGYQGAA